jgi:hypothetical protein
MFRRYYNLVLMAIWFAIAMILIVPEWVLPEKAAAKLGGPQSVLAGCLALVFVVYNGVRWYSYRMLYRNRMRGRPFQVRTVSETGPAYENNPELDFFKPAAPEPSTNGDAKH